MRDIQRYLSGGGTLKDLYKQIVDAGLTVESAIAFGKWLVDDDATRQKGLEECGRDMEIIRELEDEESLRLQRDDRQASDGSRRRR